MRVFLLLFFTVVSLLAEAASSECNESLFLTELSVRTSCDEYKQQGCLNQKGVSLQCPEVQYDCQAVEVAQRTDDPAGMIHFMLSVGLSGAEIEKMAKGSKIPTNLSKLMFEYRAEVKNLNYIRNLGQMNPAMVQAMAKDENLIKDNKAKYLDTMKMKAEIYRKLGLEMPAPKTIPAITSPPISYYSGATPAERFLAAREKVLEETRLVGDGAKVSAPTMKEWKESFKELRAFRKTASAGVAAAGKSGAVVQMRGAAMALLPDIIDPGPIKKVDYRRLACPAGSFAAYDAVPVEIKQMMDVENCQVKLSAHGVQTLLSGDGETINMIDKTPRLCKVLQAQLETLRAKQGANRTRSGVIQDLSAPSSR